MDWTVGVDVSKAKLEAALMGADGKFHSKVFQNSSSGFVALASWLEAATAGAEAHVCLEATGVYHEAVALFLHERGVCVSVINPAQAKRFSESEGVRNKTDRTDAKVLARLCRKNEPPPWEPPSPAVRALQSLVARLDTLQAMRQAELNRLEVAHSAVQGSLREVVAMLERSIADVKAQIRRTIDDDPDLRQRSALLQTIPGLGERTIPQLLAYIGRPERFGSVKALVAYARLSPFVRQSGSSVDKRRGTHPAGHRELKRALYFPAMVAGRHNPIVAAFWQRLKAQNKPGKLIVEACMHKLLAIVYGVLKHKTPFDPTRLAAFNA